MKCKKDLEKEIGGLQAVVSRYRYALGNFYFFLKKKSKEKNEEPLSNYEKDLLEYLEENLGFPDDTETKENCYKKHFSE